MSVTNEMLEDEEGLNLSDDVGEIKGLASLESEGFSEVCNFFFPVHIYITNFVESTSCHSKSHTLVTCYFPSNHFIIIKFHLAYSD